MTYPLHFRVPIRWSAGVRPVHHQVFVIVVYKNTCVDYLINIISNNISNKYGSYNGFLCHFAPKRFHNGAKPIQLANSLAVPIFNNGFESNLSSKLVMERVFKRGLSSKKKTFSEASGFS